MKHDVSWLGMGQERSSPTGDERRIVFILILALWVIVKIMLLVRIELLSEPGKGLAEALSWQLLLFHLISMGPCLAISYGIYLTLSRARDASIPAQVGVAALCTIGAVLAIHIVDQFAVIVMTMGGAGAGLEPSIKMTLVFGWAHQAGYCASILVLLHVQKLRSREGQAAQLAIEAREERIRSMRYQVDPHLLFNALNSIAAMVLDRKNDVAENMLLRLAAYYRRMLMIDPLTDITLEHEIDLQTEFLGVEQMRFESCLRIVSDIDSSARFAKVPSFILQPLVENAVKHGSARRLGDPATLSIEAHADGEWLRIQVSNAVGGRDAPVRGCTGTGLRNVRERLQARYGSHYEFSAEREGDRFVAKLALPLEIEQSMRLAA